jgi:hypothetical protein
VTNTATDTDIPANILTYQLINPPLGAQIDTNGVITWTPTAEQGGTSNQFETVVTDDGIPPMSATNAFTVVVRAPPPPPVILSLSLSNGVAIIKWSALEGQNFKLQYKDSLQDTNWEESPTAFQAIGSTVTATNIVEGAAQRYYRVRLTP